VDTSKPANGAEPEQEYSYLDDGRRSKYCFDSRAAQFILAIRRQERFREWCALIGIPAT
jgi:hypothetical protein